MSDIRPLNDVEKHILDAIEGIRFGAVEVLIHDSKVVQIERSVKTRFDKKQDVSV